MPIGKHLNIFGAYMDMSRECKYLNHRSLHSPIDKKNIHSLDTYSVGVDRPSLVDFEWDQISIGTHKKVPSSGLELSRV